MPVRVKTRQVCKKLKESNLKSNLGLALQGTGKLVEKSNLFPASGLVGAALEFGGTALGAQATESEKEKIKRMIQKLGEQSESLREQAEQQYRDMEAGFHEIKSDWKEIQADFNKIFDEVKEENKAIVAETKSIKDIGALTKIMVEDLTYKAGFDLIDGAYAAFLDQSSFEDFKYYAFELQTNAKTYFEKAKVQKYMEAVKERGAGSGSVLIALSYVIIVLAKYVQMMIQYHIFHEDAKMLVDVYKYLNDNIESYSMSYMSVTGQELDLNDATMERLNSIRRSLE